MGTLYHFLKLVLPQNKKLRKKGRDKSGLGGSDRRHSVPPNGFYAISANILQGTVIIFFDPFGFLQGRELGTSQAAWQVGDLKTAHVSSVIYLLLQAQYFTWTSLGRTHCTSACLHWGEFRPALWPQNTGCRIQAGHLSPSIIASASQAIF